MIEEFTNDLNLQPVKLLRKSGDDLVNTPYVVVQELEGYVFNTRQTVRDESGYSYVNSFNLYFDSLIELKADDRIEWNGNVYLITSKRVSNSKTINYMTLTLTYNGNHS